MKIRQKREYQNKTLEELIGILSSLLKNIENLKINSSKEKNLKVFKFKRQEIAIVKTIIREKKLEVHE